MTTIRTQPDKSSRVTSASSRRSVRVLLSMPILVSGKNSRNESFQEETKTLVVNVQGALIALGTPLPVGHEITLQNKATHHSRPCRIAHIGNASDGKTQLGVEFLQPSPGFWQIDFPPENWVTPES